MIDAPPPPPPLHNIDVEQALLGAILVNNDALSSCEGLLPAHFFEAMHSRIFEAISTLIRAGKLASAITVKTFFERDDTLKEIGGTKYLARLAGSAATIVNARGHAEIVRDLALRRQGQRLVEQAAADIANPAVDQSAAEYLSGLAAELSKISEGGETRRTTFTAGELSAMAGDETAAAYENRGRPLNTIPTGIVVLDALIGGLGRGKFIVAGGRPGMGKSALGVALAYSTALSGVPALIISLEMTGVELAHRLNSLICGVPYFRAQLGHISEAEYSALVQAREVIAGLPLRIDARDSATLPELGAIVARTLNRQPNLGLIVIDHAGLVAPGDRYRGNKYSEISELTASLKSLAKRYDLAVVAQFQLNRRVEERDDKRPKLFDLRDSGSIEQDADIVLFPYRDEYYAGRELDAATPGSPEAVDLADRLRRCADRMEIAVAKHRGGPIGVAHVGCDIACNRIFDLTAPHHERRP